MDEAPRDRLLALLRAEGHVRLDKPVELASGEMSSDFVDCKRALAAWPDLELACRLVADAVAEAGVDYHAVGGLTLGADALAVGVAAVTDTRWFVVRKEPKGRGTGRLVEGARIDGDTRVLLVDDVVTTGGSLLKAYEAVRGMGAEVVAASAIVDRGEVARRRLDALGVPYRPILTYKDLEIAPVGGGQVGAAAAG